MTTRITLLLTLVLGSAAFLLGSRSQDSGHRSESPSGNPRGSRVRPEMPLEQDAPRDGRNTPFETISHDEAGRLSPAKRLEAVAMAARLTDINQQAQILRGVIAVMSRDELPDAVRVLLDARIQGGDISHAVWSALWERVGEVAPEIVLNADRSASMAISKVDLPNFMDGWFKADPDAAMAWAMSGNQEEWMAPAVARAITSSAGGDLRQMEAAILKLSRTPVTTRECLQDYYDLALVSGGKAGPAELYENLSPELREAAWPVTLGRLTYSAPREAAAWLEEHSKDSGVDFRQTEQLLYRLGNQDPAWTMEWLSRVEVDNIKNGQLQGPPLSWTLENIWRSKDPAALNAWQAEQRAKYPPAENPSTLTR